MQENASPQRTYLDLDTALSRVRGNKTIFRKMLGLFQKSVEFSAFEEALSAADYPKAAQHAHSIKGMTGNLAMDALFEESSDLMLQLRQGYADVDTLARFRDALIKTNEIVASLMAEGDA